MAAIIQALDNYTPKKEGENGHVEYGWSNNLQEKILQFSFQVTRTTDDKIDQLAQTLSDLLQRLSHRVKNGSMEDIEKAKELLSVLYRMIGHTRDIIDGKGEYTLAYMMVYTWYQSFPELAKYALKCFVELEKSAHQYGSWKDIKYFCNYCRSKGESVQFELIQYCIVLTNEQLKRDMCAYALCSNNVSLAAKWVPREKSSFGWLYESLATHYFSHYVNSAKTDIQVKKAVLKCMTEYRKVLSKLNRYIDTLQIKQCDKSWSKINFQKVTSISLTKQKKAFLNVKKDGKVRYPEDEDRIECAEHFKSHIQRAVKGETEMKGKRVSMADFTKQALSLNSEHSIVEKDLLNSQWKDNAAQNAPLGKMIAMVDVSGSMRGDPMNVAIALGIRIAEKSVLGNRILTFSSTPKWFDLESCKDSFVDKVHALTQAEWGVNTNFHAALDMILNAIVDSKVSAEEVEDMVLVILSDMQMDQGDTCNKDTLYKEMQLKYADAGMKVCGKPYRPPHILFWNLRSTDGFPTLSTQANTSMMSGFNPVLLNVFCDQGMTALQSCTPWSLLVKSLDNERYQPMQEFLHNPSSTKLTLSIDKMHFAPYAN